MGGRNGGQEEEGKNFNLEQIMSYAQDHAAFKTVKHSFIHTALAGVMNRTF